MIGYVVNARQAKFIVETKDRLLGSSFVFYIALVYLTGFCIPVPDIVLFYSLVGNQCSEIPGICLVDTQSVIQSIFSFPALVSRSRLSALRSANS